MLATAEGPTSESVIVGERAATVSHTRSPRGCHYSVDVRELRLKSDKFVCEGGVGDENWRISRAARGMHHWDYMTGHTFYRVDDTADGGCLSRAEI